MCQVRSGKARDEQASSRRRWYDAVLFRRPACPCPGDETAGDCDYGGSLVKHTPLVELVDSSRRARIMYSLLLCSLPLGAALGGSGVKQTSHTGSGVSSSTGGGRNSGAGCGG